MTETYEIPHDIEPNSYCLCEVCMAVRVAERQVRWAREDAERQELLDKLVKRQRTIRILFFPAYLLLMVFMAITYLCFFAIVDLFIVAYDAYHPGRYDPDYMWPALLPWLKRWIYGPRN